MLASYEAKTTTKPKAARLTSADIIKAKKPKCDPTGKTYTNLNHAYDYFNKALFKGALPSCLITLQRHSKALGYFAPERFGSRDGKETTDEIALNPSHFKDRDTKDVLSTLVHEQAHLWQKHFGKMPSGGYHDKAWGVKMKEIGLYPSSTAKPGGKETGRSMSHYIIEGGPFEVACDALLKKGFEHLYVELWNETEAAKKKREQKAKSKTKYTCAECETNAWAKPGTLLTCGVCDVSMDEAE